MQLKDNLEITRLENGRYGLRDVTTDEFLDGEYDRIERCDDGWYIVRVRGRSSFINPTTKQTPEHWFDGVNGFSNGWADVMLHGKHGFYSPVTGELPEQWFDETDGLDKDGWARVKDGDDYSYYNVHKKSLSGRAFKKCEHLCLGWGVVQKDDDSYTYYTPETDTLCQKSFIKAWQLDYAGFGEVQTDKDSRAYFNPEDEYVFRARRVLDRYFVKGDDHVHDIGFYPEEFEHFPHASFHDRYLIRSCLNVIAGELERRCANNPSPETEREVKDIYSLVRAKLEREKEITTPTSEIPGAIKGLLDSEKGDD